MSQRVRAGLAGCRCVVAHRRAYGVMVPERVWAQEPATIWRSGETAHGSEAMARAVTFTKWRDPAVRTPGGMGTLVEPV